MLPIPNVLAMRLERPALIHFVSAFAREPNALAAGRKIQV
jgi:hypothetical protein